MQDLTVQSDLSQEQIELIKSTIARGATNEELKLFLYRCKAMGLDPLKSGHIHFIKYGSNPGSIVVGLDGFRLRAAKTGKHVGTDRGCIRDGEGKCIGAWCEVYRSDWTKPAREEVSLAEYNTGKAQWQKMPETMIKKVAEVAALRMAFPDELGGLYSEDEMGPIAPTVKPLPSHTQLEQGPLISGTERAQALQEAMMTEEQPPMPPFPLEPFTQADHDLAAILVDPVPVYDWGAKPIAVGKKYKGKTFDDVGPDAIKSYSDWVYVEAQKTGKPIAGPMVGFLADAHEYLLQKGYEN